MIDFDHIQDQIAQDLSQSRKLTDQVLSYIAHHYDCHVDQLAEFFNGKVKELEEYELDLVFSPLFTPIMSDRVPYGALLGAETLDTQQVNQLVQASLTKQLNANFEVEAGEKFSMPLAEVMVERYVRRLFLDKPLPTPLYEAIQAFVPAEAKADVNILGRDPVWQVAQHQVLLPVFLQAFTQQNNFSVEKADYLTNFIRTYQPQTMTDLERQLEALIKSCQEDLPKVQNRGLLDSDLKMNYMDRAPHESPEQRAITTNYLRMMSLAQALKMDAQYIREHYTPQSV